jgi:alanine racemase
MGDTLTPDHVADIAGTIGYEVLTRLGTRFHRRYVNGPAATA